MLVLKLKMKICKGYISWSEWQTVAVGDSSPQAGDSGFHPIPLEERTFTLCAQFGLSTDATTGGILIFQVLVKPQFALRKTIWCPLLDNALRN